MSDLCKCLTTPGRPTGHPGHCCLEQGEVDDYAPDKPLPCGHEGVVVP